jgi:hypothetical protein
MTEERDKMCVCVFIFFIDVDDNEYKLLPLESCKTSSSPPASAAAAAVIRYSSESSNFNYDSLLSLSLETG